MARLWPLIFSKDPLRRIPLDARVLGARLGGALLLGLLGCDPRLADLPDMTVTVTLPGSYVVGVGWESPLDVVFTYVTDPESVACPLVSEEMSATIDGIDLEVGSLGSTGEGYMFTRGYCRGPSWFLPITAFPADEIAESIVTIEDASMTIEVGLLAPFTTRTIEFDPLVSPLAIAPGDILTLRRSVPGDPTDECVVRFGAMGVGDGDTIYADTVFVAPLVASDGELDTITVPPLEEWAATPPLSGSLNVGCDRYPGLAGVTLCVGVADCVVDYRYFFGTSIAVTAE